MYQIQLGSIIYDLIPSGYGHYDDKLTAQIYAENIPLTEVEEVLSNVSNVDHIEIIDKDRKEVVEAFNGYEVLESIRKDFDVVVETTINEETQESTEVKADVIAFVLTKPSIEQTVAKNTADIEYIAVMSDIELS